MERASKRRRLSPPGEQSEPIPGFAKWNIEQDYERKPRKTKKNNDSNRLPVKSEESGRWEKDAARPEASDSDNDSFLASDGNDGGAVADLTPREQFIKPKVSPKEEIRQAKEELARAAGLLNENPEEHIGLLSSLGQLARSNNLTVKKLALGTQYAIYKDIIPGYRIRSLTKDEIAGKLSKEVKQLRNFEQSLLSGYKDYVQMLARLVDDKDASDPSVVSVAISCACDLLTQVPHFNLRNDLVAILVKRLSTRQADADSAKCREALEQLFRDDEDGSASLEAVGQLTRMMKAKNYNVQEGVLNTFLHLRLLSEFSQKASTNRVDKGDEQPDEVAKKVRQKKQFRTKREKKILRERKDIEKEMKEADAVVSFEERDQNQAEMLKLVFVAYFRILKARTRHLMGAVLEGLAKYAHLINQDFFGDVLESLKDLIKEASEDRETEDEDVDNELLETDRQATRESLLCIITAFALLQGQHDVVKSANSLHLDLSFFITHLYQTLLPSSLDSNIEAGSKVMIEDPNGLTTLTGAMQKDAKINISTTMVLLFRSLQSVLLPTIATKSVPPVRIAAFTKQLHTLCLQLPQKSALAALSLLQKVVKVHGNKVAALWNTEERKGDGVFDALSGSVEGSNPFASTIWEGELLRYHFDPKIREAVVGIESGIKEATK